MLKNTIETLRDNNYEGLKGVLLVTDMTLFTMIIGDVMFKYAPLIVGTGIVGQASLIIAGGGLMAILPPIVGMIHKKIF